MLSFQVSHVFLREILTKYNVNLYFLNIHKKNPGKLSPKNGPGEAVALFLRESISQGSFKRTPPFR